MSSKRFLSIALAGVFVGTASAAMAGTQSMLDPYASVEPPKPVKKKMVKQQPQPVAADQAPQTATTYVTMPMGDNKDSKTAQSGDSNQGAGGGMFGGVKNMGSNCTKTVKAAGSGIVNGTKAAGSKIAAGTKKIGGGIANGAQKSGELLAKGAKAIGNGFKSTGEKMKDGTQAMGSKVASLPKLFKKDKGELKVRQSAIASTSGSQSEPANLSPAPQTAKVTPLGQPRQQPKQVANLEAITQRGDNAQPKTGTLAKFGKAFGKFNLFKKDEAARATAANPNGAVPQ